jgi:hypothetical protein
MRQKRILVVKRIVRLISTGSIEFKAVEDDINRRCGHDKWAAAGRRA